MVPLPHRSIAGWSPCLIVLLLGGLLASSFYCLVVPLPHRSIVWWSPCLIVLLFGGPLASSFYCLVVPLPHCSIASIVYVGVHYSDFIPLNLFPLTTAASVSQSDTVIMVSEDGGSVFVCAEIYNLPAEGLECGVVVMFAFSPGSAKAGMLTCSECFDMLM